MYNDLKEDNVMINENGEATLIDFGLCTKYVDEKGEHIFESEVCPVFRGNFIFSSPHALQFGRPSRKDDLFQLCYFLIFLLNGSKFPGELEKDLNLCQDYLELIYRCYRYKKDIKLPQLALCSQNMAFLKFCDFVQ